MLQERASYLFDCRQTYFPQHLKPKLCVFFLGTNRRCNSRTSFSLSMFAVSPVDFFSKEFIFPSSFPLTSGQLTWQRTHLLSWITWIGRKLILWDIPWVILLHPVLFNVSWEGNTCLSLCRTKCVHINGWMFCFWSLHSFITCYLVSLPVLLCFYLFWFIRWYDCEQAGSHSSWTSTLIGYT